MAVALNEPAERDATGVTECWRRIPYHPVVTQQRPKMPRSRKSSTTFHLEEHSVAKAQFISAYLSVLLRIMERSNSVRDVYICDLMCGDGVYSNGAKGTAYEVMAAAKRHFYADAAARGGSGIAVNLLLNDSGDSDVEDGISKACHVKKSCASLIRTIENDTPYKVSISEHDALDLAHGTLGQCGGDPRRRFLLIFDPRGYSRVTPGSLRELLSHAGVEVFLFVPVSQMYRTSLAIQKRGHFDGSGRMKTWLDALWGAEEVEAEGAVGFLGQLRQRLAKMLGDGHYVGTFQLDSASSQNSYGLLFISQHLRGLEVMNEVKWDYDPIKGEGHRRDRFQFVSFSPARDQFSQSLVSFIQSAGAGRSNRDVAAFTITRGFQVKDAKAVLDPFKRAGSIVTLDSGGRRARGYHLNRKTRDEQFRWIRWVPITTQSHLPL